MSEFMKSLKVGDEVAIPYRYSNSGWRICKVENITPTGRVTVAGSTFNPDGTFSSILRCLPVTPEIRREVRRTLLVDRLRVQSWDLMSLELLEEVNMLIARKGGE